MIVEENLLPGSPSTEWEILGAGDLTNLGFAREFSINTGDTINFSCHGTGTVIDIYRIGWYQGFGWRKVASLTNTATQQPDPQIIPNSNNGHTCTHWSTTATWNTPAGTVSGLYVGVYRNGDKNNASYIPFVIRDDARQADIIIKTSDTTWALAYNKFNTVADPSNGPSLYSRNTLWDSENRTHAVTYHRPIITRSNVPQTYWLNCEAPLIRFAERNGLNVKYISSKDLDQVPGVLDNSKVFISSGHDEYWTDNMRESIESYRDKGNNVLFMSANEVFWRTRFDTAGDTMWCYKDTMAGPGDHIAGTPLDPVTWTGTWKDTRWPNRKPENTLTGTDFRMNGVSDNNALMLSTANYVQHPAWRNTTLASGSPVTLVGIIGFEADRLAPTQPTESTRILAAHTLNIDGAYANDNGQDYTGNGDLVWGIVSQRYSSGSVVIGFGTCQFAWALDKTHDRGTPSENVAAQQFILNILSDLGAQPETPLPSLTAPIPVSRSAYGALPQGGQNTQGIISQFNGKPVTVYLKDSSGEIRRVEPIVG